MFGAEFDETSLIGEDRLTAEEWTTSPRDQTPLLDEITAALRECTSHEEQLTQGRRLFLGDGDEDGGDGDDETLGELLRAQPLTRALLRLTAAPRSLNELAQDLVPSWAATTDKRHAAARHAVALYVALLSRVRTAPVGPLLGVDVQLWVREVSRLLRRLSSSPRFRWHDGAVVVAVIGADAGVVPCSRTSPSPSTRRCEGASARCSTWRAARARDELIVTWSGAPSPFLPLPAA